MCEHLAIRLKETLVGELRLVYCCRADPSVILEGYLHVRVAAGGSGGLLAVWRCGLRPKRSEHAGRGQQVNPRYTNMLKRQLRLCLVYLLRAQVS